MGYNLIIGEAEITQDGEFIRIWAKPEQLPDAPDHCPFTKKGNMRSPSYTAWHEFCEDAGIEQMFYGAGWDRTMRQYAPPSDDFYRETPILREHPGAAGLVHGDLEFVTAARKRREASNGGKPPGFWDDDGHGREVDTGKDPTLARLLWLEFWIKWALDNCEHPVLVNS